MLKDQLSGFEKYIEIQDYETTILTDQKLFLIAAFHY